MWRFARAGPGALRAAQLRLRHSTTHITVNLAPADIRKEGSGFDLPMALGILGAYGGLNKKELLDCVFVGELSLDGGVRGIRHPARCYRDALEETGTAFPL